METSFKLYFLKHYSNSSGSTFFAGNGYSCLDTDLIFRPVV